MDGAQELLFGGFPRRVGTPAQHWVFNAAQFELFLDVIEGDRNAYATICRMDPSEGPVADKVFFDFDGDKSALPDDAPADERIAMMRHDPDLADAVLGDVCHDVNRLVRESRDDGIPTVGVFSGFGIHVYQLYQPTVDPQVPMATCGAKYIDELGLETADWAVVGDVQRIARIPNVERTTYNTGEREQVLDGRGTGLYTVALSAGQLCDADPAWLLEASQQPMTGVLPAVVEDRPQMPVWEAYRDGAETEGTTAQRPVDQRTVALDDDGIDYILDQLLRLPCMAERITQPNPEHEVRLNCAVLLFNAGLNPQQVENLYSRLGWVDWNRDVTRGHLDHIYRNKYSDMNCKTLRRDGLCVMDDDARDCDCYGWSGGQPEW